MKRWTWTMMALLLSLPASAEMGSWAKARKGAVKEKAGVVKTFDGNVLHLAVAEGKQDPTQAVMQGKLKVQGDMAEAMQLVKLFMPG